jgi:hypothetical protein
MYTAGMALALYRRHLKTRERRLALTARLYPFIPPPL